MTDPINCIVTINGNPVATTAAQYAREATALDGLVIRWGRASRLAQPTASTATVALALNPANPLDDLERVHVGAELTVQAEYETAAAGGALTILQDSTRRKHVQSAPGLPIEAVYLPAPHSTRPEAWDNLPRIEYGSVIAGHLDITAPLGSTITLSAIYYTAPTDSAREDGETLYTSTHNGQHSFTFKPDTKHAGKWFALRVVVHPVGQTWAQTRKDWSGLPLTWDTLRTVWMSNLHVTRPDGETHTATVFSGRITDAPLEWDEAAQRPVLTLTAVDFTAELANRRVGDEPWPSETIAARFNRVLRAARLSHLRAILPPIAHIRTIAAADIDSRPALELLTTLAKAAGGILWASAHDTIGAYIRLEDPSERRPLYRLDVHPSGGARLEAGAAAAIRIPAEDITTSGVVIEQDVSDYASNVSVRWKDIDTDGRTVERTESLDDPRRTETHGYRSISISTDLNKQSDAAALARETLTRAAPGAWTIPAATLTPRRTPAAHILKLLDATHRLGRPLIIDGVAPWIPGAPSVPVYLDGGTYTYQGGQWRLGMTFTRAATPGRSVTWQQLPAALTWQRTTLTYLDLSTATI